MYQEQESDLLDALLSSIAQGGLRAVDGRGFGQEGTGTGAKQVHAERAIGSYHGRPDIEAVRMPRRKETVP